MCSSDLFALADSLDVKPGAWDMSITTLTRGSLIPPNLLAKMPPEQRAKFEQSMQARSGKPMTHNSKECVTQEDLDQDRMLKEPQEDGELQSTTRVVSRSSRKLVIDVPSASRLHIPDGHGGQDARDYRRQHRYNTSRIRQSSCGHQRPLAWC